jgi:hypothetical protein
MPVIERTDHLTELLTEAIDAEGKTCPECHDVGPHDRLFVFSTRHGKRVRVHDGAFCSKFCHDIYHGLRPRK